MDIKRFKDEIALLILSILSMFIVYGYELTHFTLSVDEEFYNNFDQTVALGRWGHAILRKFILPEPYAPFFTTLISLLFLSLSILVSTKTLKLNFNESVVFILFFVGMPQFSYQMEFSNQSDTVSLGILLSCVSVFLYTTNKIQSKITRFISCSLLMAFSTAIYQSIILIPIAIYLSTFLFTGFDKAKLKSVFTFLTMLVIGLIIYKLVSYMFPKSSDAGFNQYVSSQLKWLHSDVSQTLNDIYLSIKAYFTGNAPYSLNGYMLSLASIPLICFKSNRAITKSISLVLLIALPFSFNFTLGGYQPARVLVAMPFSFAIVAVALFRKFNTNYLVVFLGVVFIACSSANVSRMFYSDYMSLNADISLSNNIMTDIRRIHPDYKDGVTPIFFYGGLYRKNVWFLDNAETFGVSFFTWGGGDNKRIKNFMSLNDIANINSVTDVSTIRIIYKEMDSSPAYPSNGSIKIINGIVAVKLGEPWSPAP